MWATAKNFLYSKWAYVLVGEEVAHMDRADISPEIKEFVTARLIYALS